MLLPAGGRETFVELYLLLRSELYISPKLNIVLKKDGKLNIHYFKNLFKIDVRGIFFIISSGSFISRIRSKKEKGTAPLNHMNSYLYFISNQ